MTIVCICIALQILFATAVATTAGKAGEDENKPYEVAGITSVKARVATASEAVEKHDKQHYIAGVATTAVCAVCKKAVHVMYLLFYWILLLHYLTQPSKFVLLIVIEYLISKYTFVWII